MICWVNSCYISRKLEDDTIMFSAGQAKCDSSIISRKQEHVESKGESLAIFKYRSHSHTPAVKNLILFDVFTV